MKPHTDFQKFFNALKSNPGFFKGKKEEVFRQGIPRWMSRQFRFTGLGSANAGGRWTVKGLMPTVYASTHPTTLAKEANYKSLHYGWTPSQFKPQIIVGMKWELQKVLNLMDPVILTALNLTHAKLTLCDWEGEQMAGKEALTQALGRAAFENLAEGLVVPSARQAGGINMVYYPSNRLDGSVIQTSNESEIPFIHGIK